MQTGQMFTFGLFSFGSFKEAQNIFVLVFNSTCISNPIVGWYFINSIRGAENRTRPTCTPCMRTADILHPGFIKFIMAFFQLKFHSKNRFTTPYQFSFFFFWRSWRNDGLRREILIKYFLTLRPVLGKTFLSQAEKPAYHYPILICPASAF